MKQWIQITIKKCLVNLNLTRMMRALLLLKVRERSPISKKFNGNS